VCSGSRPPCRPGRCLAQFLRLRCAASAVSGTGRAAPAWSRPFALGGFAVAPVVCTTASAGGGPERQPLVPDAEALTQICARCGGMCLGPGRSHRRGLCTNRRLWASSPSGRATSTSPGVRERASRNSVRRPLRRMPRWSRRTNQRLTSVWLPDSPGGPGLPSARSSRTVRDSAVRGWAAFRAGKRRRSSPSTSACRFGELARVRRQAEGRVRGRAHPD